MPIAPPPRWLVAVALAALTLLAFGSFAGHEFTSWDDPSYVTQNARVLSGLSLDNVLWAFTTTEVANWHPLTWLSHMLDVELFGLEASGHHRSSLLLHLVNGLLLFWLLLRTTNALGRSAMVAALFLVHPAHVESVAWVAERKDVLSASFFLLAALAYVSFVERRTALRYAALLLLFAAGLLAKPMVVTLPFVLLLLDVWPLGRFSPAAAMRLGVEKLPLLALSLASSAVTLIAQAPVAGLRPLSLVERLGHALVSYLRYTGLLLWPVDLSVDYAQPEGGFGPWLLAAFVFVAGVTVVAVRGWRARPWLLVGWLWYLGMLVPVLGLVQFGPESMADRYTYLPAIGLFLVVAWGAHELAGAGRARSAALVVAGVLVIANCAGLTRVQTGHWRDSRTLFEHALAVNPLDAHAHEKLGNLAEDRGDLDAAIARYRLAVEHGPERPTGWYNLGTALLRRGDAAAAAGYLARALEADAGFTRAHLNLAVSLHELGRRELAETHYRAALAAHPRNPAAHASYASLLEERGEREEAIRHYREALRLDPRQGFARQRLGRLLGPAARP